MNQYDRVAQSEEFKELKRSKNRFIWPIAILFFLYYLAFPLMAGYAKPLMSHFLFGNITFGYLYGLTFYFVAWALAGIYVVKAKSFDKKVADITRKYFQKGA